MTFNEEQLVEDFLMTIPIVESKTKTLFLISFVGLPGCGKSFIAKKISEKLNLYVYINDAAKRFLNNLGFEGECPAPHIIGNISEESCRYLLKNKVSHIIDADLIIYHDNIKQIAESFGAKLYIIEIICPEEIILERIEKRQQDIKLNRENNFSRATTKEYFARKKLHNLLPKPEFFFSIDTSVDMDGQIDNLIFKLKQEKII